MIHSPEPLPTSPRRQLYRNVVPPAGYRAIDCSDECGHVLTVLVREDRIAELYPEGLEQHLQLRLDALPWRNGGGLRLV